MAPRRYSGTHYVPGMTAEQAHRAAQLEYPVLAAVLLTIPVLVLTSLELEGGWGVVVQVLNWLIWLTFLVEVVVMLRIAPDNKVWARHNVLDLAILVLTPPFLPEPFQVLWVIRLLRILDLLPLLGTLFTFNGFRYAALLAFIAIFGGGIAFAELEDGQKLDAFEGVYWATTTISTVGYGDISPETTAGRVLTMMLMLMGPVLIGLVATGIGAAVTKQIHRELEEAQQDTSGLREQLGELGVEVGEVEEDVASLSAVDRAILERLALIDKRLASLEKRGPPGP